MAKITKLIKLQVPAGKATPAPPVGTALGPAGVNIGEFVTKFNEASKGRMGDIVPVEITVFEDRSFKFVMKTPPATSLLKKAAGIESGVSKHSEQRAGKVTKAQIREIAEKKMPDLNATEIEQAMKIIEGSARSMGLDVVA